jgi:glucan biosynthesis protein
MSAEVHHIRLAREQMERFQQFQKENPDRNTLTNRKRFFSRFDEIQITYNILRETLEWIDQTDK